VARDIERGAADARAYVSGESGGQFDEVRRVQALQEHASQIDVPKASWADFTKYYGKWSNGKVLLGTAGS
jgi:PHS family inorganic phosphate transporter-like MFS transporter